VGVAAFYRQRQASQFRGLYESMRESEQLLSEAEAVGQLGSFVFDIQADQFRSSENLDRMWASVPSSADRRRVAARRASVRSG